MKRILFLGLLLSLGVRSQQLASSNGQSTFVVVKTAQTSSLASTAIVASVASNSMWRISAQINCANTAAAATAAVTITYTDISNTSQSITVGAAAACTTLGSASIAGFVQAFCPKAGTAINYSAAVVGSPTYDLRLTLEQITQN